MTETTIAAPPVKKPEIALPLVVLGAAVVVANYWWLKRQAEIVAEHMTTPYLMDESGQIKRASRPPAHWMSGG